MKHRLEQSKLFAPIAWCLVIVFALFVGHLAVTFEQSLTPLNNDATIAELLAH